MKKQCFSCVNESESKGRGRRRITGVFAGELGLGVAHPLGSLAAALVGAVVAVLVGVAPPALGNARAVHHAVELLAAALDGGREDCSETRWKKRHVTERNRRRWLCYSTAASD